MSVLRDLQLDWTPEINELFMDLCFELVEQKQICMRFVLDEDPCYPLFRSRDTFNKVVDNVRAEDSWLGKELNRTYAHVSDTEKAWRVVGSNESDKCVVTFYKPIKAV